MDAARLQRSFGVVASNGDRAAQVFYAYLFVAYPEVRDMFPISMGGQRDKLLHALGHIVSHVDRIEQVVPFVQGLGRDHRKFGVTKSNYAQVGEALIYTLAKFLGEEWTKDLAADWTAAYQIVAETMVTAADQAAATPPWWNADVLEHRRRSNNLATITVRPHQPMFFWPGQSISIESALRPRVWRMYSPANAPRRDSTIEFHVRAHAGGQLSPALVHQIREGDVLRMGAPTGVRLTLAPGGGRDLLLVAGGTGLAPMRALVEQVATEVDSGVPARRVDLYVGARNNDDLYDAATMSALNHAHPWLTVVTVTDDGPYRAAQDVMDVALAAGRWHDREIYVCGPAAMTTTARDQLNTDGVPPAQIHIEEYDNHRYIPSASPVTSFAGIR
jgi:NAD(P)H-flavin reductase/hemoglobin-like flavoprotein